MKKHLVIILQDLTENHRASICAAAGRHGFDCRFFDEPSQSLPFLQDAEIIVGTDPFLSRNAPNLRWLCSPFAGVDPFLADDAFAAPSALLTCSSGFRDRSRRKLLSRTRARKGRPLPSGGNSGP